MNRKSTFWKKSKKISWKWKCHFR